MFQLLQAQPIWPHQEQAIAQGLWILDTRGSVLIADATGSGKTRVGTHLLYSLLNRLWSKGQSHRTKATVICPPNVTDNWSLEIRASPASPVQAISHGKLSQGKDLGAIHRQVRESNILFLDEAHNYLSEDSTRSAAIEAGAPDYTALLTATPINTGSADLLRMIELLGLDNLSDSEFDTYRTLSKKISFTAVDEEMLRTIVRQCTIRRTKQDLNRYVAKNREGYTTAAGVVHQYPTHRCKTYPTGETKEDQQHAREIERFTQQLRGLLWLRTFRAPPWVLGDPAKEKEFLQQTIRAASGLIGHSVSSSLQSSKAALLELVYGTEAASERVGLEPGLKDSTGNYIQRVTELLETPPRTASNLHIGLPDWLDDDLEQTVRQERDLLRQIGERAQQLSDARMRTRAQKVQEIAAHESVIIVFGARPLTLYHLKHHLEATAVTQDVVVADGSKSRSDRQRITRRLGLRERQPLTLNDEADVNSGVVALCSDAMSEGLNLQRAASVVLLDTPSVIRIAEQRVGRIDRMNSPHEEITVWWPDDSPPFRSRKRNLLVERYNVNGRLMGNNIKLPASLRARSEELTRQEAASQVSATDLIEEYRTLQQSSPSDRLEDAFQPIRQLVGLDADDASEGVNHPEPLIQADVYEQVADVETAVWSQVTLRSSARPWGFFCLRGRERQAPRWIFLSKRTDRSDPTALGFDADTWAVDTQLGHIAMRLRDLLPASQPILNDKDPEIWDAVEPTIEELLKRIRNNETELLSNRAQHVLHVLRTLTARYQKVSTASEERKEICRFLYSATTTNQEPEVDLYSLADEWLGILQPRYIEHKTAAKHHRNEVLRLKDMVAPLIHEPVGTEALRHLAESVRPKERLERRIAAAIIAVPNAALDR